MGWKGYRRRAARCCAVAAATPALALFALRHRHRDSLELVALYERDVGDGAAILQRRCDADGAEASVASQGLLHRCSQGSLGLGHRRALALCGGVIFAFGNRLGLDDLTGVVVYDHLEEPPPISVSELIP